MTDLSYFPEDFYPAIPEGEDSFRRLVNLGRKRMEGLSVAFCSLFRDSEPELPRFFARLEKLGSYFKDWTLLAYENDSCDATVGLISEWVKANAIRIPLGGEVQDRDWFKSEQLGAPKFGQVTTLERRKAMAYYRNQYLLAIQPILDSLDYVIVLDSDLKGGFSYDGVASSFGIEDFDMIGANGLSYTGTFQIRPHFYDTWALETYDGRTPFLPFQRGEAFVPVRSTFCGLGIYRAECLKGLKYLDTKCDHATIAEQIIERGYNKIFINPSMVAVYDFPKDKSW